MVFDPRKKDRKRPSIGAPSNNLGQDGDIEICLTKQGLALYGKFNNQWHPFSKAQEKGLVNKDILNILEINNSITLKNQSSLKFFGSSNKYSTSFKQSNSATESIEFTLPTSAPGGAKVLTTISSGQLSWEDPNPGDITEVVASTGISGGGTAGQVTVSLAYTNQIIWQSFPFQVASGTHSRYYFLDNDDADDFRKWDAYDTSPTGINYRGVAGQFVVPQDCTLQAMYGIIANNSSTNNPTVYVYHGTHTEGTGDSTLASAGSVNVTIGTTRVPYGFNKTDFDVNLDAGDIVVPMIKHDDTSATRTFVGSLTLKFMTR